ncbi:SH3 domain containing protein [Lactarius tabidus]
MPFANLPAHEKDAFFALLDEYFTSRPDLLARVGGTSDSAADIQSPIPAAAAFTAAQRALANPATQQAAQRALANPATSRALAAGFQRAGNAALASSTTSPPPAPPSRSSSSTAVDSDAAAPAINFGRVAAAAQAFSGPPRAANPPTHKQTESAGGLVPQKKFGDVDVSSAGAMFRSLRGSTAAKSAPPPPVHTPNAFAAKKAFAPPPVRRVSAAPEPEPEPEPEEEVGGEWAEAKYDYSGQESGDLDLREGDRVLVTERTSSDWWTGEINGRSGLFPMSYVKLL